MIVLLVVGINLVSQPTFIFGSLQVQDSPYKDTYSLGAVLALSSAFFSGTCASLQPYCRNIPLAYFMLWSGVSKLIVGLLSPMVGLPNHVRDLAKFTQDFPVLTMVASFSMLGMVFTQISHKVSGNPLLVSVTRSMEIVMALVLDIITAQEQVDFTSSQIWFKIMGALLVTMSVVGIASSDILEQNMPSLCRRRQTRDGYDIFQDDESQTPLMQNNDVDYGTSSRINES